MSTIKNSIKKRDTARNAIKRNLASSKKAETLDAADLKSYLTILAEQWNKFQSAQEDVEISCGAETLQEQEAEREQGETWYREALANFTRALTKVASSNNAPEAAKADNKSHAVRADIRLPPMKLPNFDGDPKDWKPFEDAFTAFIHGESSLSSVQKLHFLLSSLQGAALQVVKGFRITNSNYDEVWELLKKRYDSTRTIVDSHFQALFSLPKLSCESSSSIRALVDETQEHFRSLKALGRSVFNWDDWLVHLTISKLDVETHRQWELAQTENKIADFQTLVCFLESRCRSLDAITSYHQITTSNNKSHTGNHVRNKKTNSLHTANPSKPLEKRRRRFQDHVCSFCSGKHLIYSCEKFRSLETTGRISFVRDKKLCENCLVLGHNLTDCQSTFTCRVCHTRHHTLLHSESLNSSTFSQQPVASTSNANFTPSYTTQSKHHVLLGTAMVHVLDKSNRPQPARLLFDNGSHASFISESCVQRLQLRRTPVTTAIEGIGATAAGSSKGEVQLTISSLNGTFSATIHAQILNKITSHLPPVQVQEYNWPHINGLSLADPLFHTPAAIDILLGSDELSQFICTGLIKGPIGTPIAQKSTLGWVLMGKVADSVPMSTYNTSFCLFADAALTKAVSKFWQIEALPEVKILSIEEKLCEQFYEDTHHRQRDGRFVVQLPFKPNCPLGSSRDSAVRALLRMEKQFDKNRQLFTQYKDFIHEFIQLGHMEEAPQAPRPGLHYYMPHRAVIKDTSTTTKLRVVFNASCRTSSGFSLNDSQMIGPQLQPDLFSTLLRLRTHRFAMCADITKMYRQVRVDKKHIDFQRIVWRDSSSDDIKDYRLLTVTYGVASASHLAVKSLQKAALDANLNSNATQVILRDFYMDDLLTGCFEETDLHHLQVEVSSILSRSGFHLRKWSSNSPTVLNAIPVDQREITQPLNFGEEDAVRTLGLQWDPISDHLRFTLQVNEIATTAITKRLLLSDTAKLFDPLGLLSPSTIIPKMLFQTLWRPKVDWDETVPHDVKNKWLHYRDHITYLAAIKVPRWVGTGFPNATTDIHGFADASQSAYAAVVYVRTVTPNGETSVCLLTAKTRVAPLKTTTLSLPRLELMGAALLAQLLTHVKATLTTQISNVYGWTDSSVALAWIRQHPGKWSTFVANRVSQIQQVVPAENWFHVQSSDNPADCATRGILPQNLQKHPLWWSGPPWLLEDKSSWPVQHLFTTKVDQRSDSINLISSYESHPIWELMEQYSSLRKLKRVTSYIMRFTSKALHAAKLRRQGASIPPKTSTHLHLCELDEALNFWIHQTQKHFFTDDIRRLQSNKPIRRCSKLLRLHPFLDQKGLIRVGGRLCNSSLHQDKKFPIILPASARLSTLICEDIHRTTLHAGPQTMLAILQSRFWIIGARQVLRKVFKSCVKCRRHANVYQQQLMGDLPLPRVEACRPFFRSGVDFAGPVKLRFSKGRGSRAVKGYISIFICMSTGAMHLELASDLSSATFIAVFKRFVSRRGHCNELYSDNGTNFVGADKELRTFLKLAIKDEHLAKYLAEDGTAWHFNPPASPHMGGYWEVAVKRVKFHLRRTLGENLLTFEEFSTLLTEIEACVNSRPLCAASSNAEDLTVLTPGYFLIGEPLRAIPEPSITEFRGNLMSRWILISSLRQHFWRRWSSEYLVQLQQRRKWNRRNPNCDIGDLVLVREEKLPPTKWRLGRIIKVHAGTDGNVRVVTLKTAEGVLMRPVVKIAPLLPVCDEPLKT